MLKVSDRSGFRAGEFVVRKPVISYVAYCALKSCRQWNDPHPLSEAILPGLGKHCLIQDMGGQHRSNVLRPGWGDGGGGVCSVYRQRLEEVNRVSKVIHAGGMTRGYWRQDCLPGASPVCPPHDHSIRTWCFPIILVLKPLTGKVSLRWFTHLFSP